MELHIWSSEYVTPNGRFFVFYWHEAQLVERSPDKREVGGSNPLMPINMGQVAKVIRVLDLCVNLFSYVTYRER